MQSIPSIIVLMLVQPSLEPCVIIIFKLTIEIINTINPAKSNFLVEDEVITFVSGVPFIKNIERNSAKTMENTKIQRQPIEEAIAPPTKEQSPVPPQEPIPQKLTLFAAVHPYSKIL